MLAQNVIILKTYFFLAKVKQMSEKKDSTKKSILLRIDTKLWSKIEEWADDDFRSVNGQIEYLLNSAVKEHCERKPKNAQR